MLRRTTIVCSLIALLSVCVPGSAFGLRRGGYATVPNSPIFSHYGYGTTRYTVGLPTPVYSATSPWSGPYTYYGTPFGNPFVQMPTGAAYGYLHYGVGTSPYQPTLTSFARNAAVHAATHDYFEHRFELALRREAEALARDGTHNPYRAYLNNYYAPGYNYGMAGASQPIADSRGTNLGPAMPTAKQISAPAAFGVPVEFGEVSWPLALRLMPPSTRQQVLDRLESQLKTVANQAATGDVSQALLREANGTINQAHAWLHDHRSRMAENTYRDGINFLDRLENTLHRMDNS